MTNKKPVKPAKAKQIETVVVSFEDYQNPDFRYPSRYCIRNGNGDMVFYKTQKRELAQQQVDAEYGVGMYRVREV
jgi:hypothetical protein